MTFQFSDSIMKQRSSDSSFATGFDFGKRGAVYVGEYCISIISGSGAYCSDDTYEVAIIDPLGNIVHARSFLGEEFVDSNGIPATSYDDVIPYVTNTQINTIVSEVEKVAGAEATVE